MVGLIGLEKCAECGKFACTGEAVIISATEYDQLCKMREDVGRRSTVKVYRMKSKSRIARDPQLAEFILLSADTMITADIVKACEKRFGPGRAPSRSSIFRFLQAMSS